MVIRQETISDIMAIHRVVVEAFKKAPHSSHTEHLIVDALRHAGALSISLVAEEADAILGHVALSPLTISDCTTDWYGLGPISVLPEVQGEGIGAQLMQAAMAELNELHANGCVLLGEPEYYQRFGFQPIDGLILPDVPKAYFMAKQLRGETPQGTVMYHEAFEVKA